MEQRESWLNINVRIALAGDIFVAERKWKKMDLNIESSAVLGGKGELWDKCVWVRVSV